MSQINTDYFFGSFIGNYYKTENKQHDQYITILLMLFSENRSTTIILEIVPFQLKLFNLFYL